MIGSRGGAVALSALWAVVAALALFLDPLARTSAALAVASVTPLGLIWLAHAQARSRARSEDAIGSLRDEVEALKAARAPERSIERAPSATGHAAPPPKQPPERSGRTQRLAHPEPRQQSLPLTEEDAQPSATVPDLVRALNFPDDPSDREGFRVLRLALADPRTRQLVQASQDVLTLLSEIGLYMDDLPLDRARPEVWRRFAAGERGRSVADVGGVRERAALAATADRMRADPVFRDAAHHFMRLFDRMLSEFAEEASDADIVALAQTRTARAFMLVGRVSGTFD